MPSMVYVSQEERLNLQVDGAEPGGEVPGIEGRSKMYRDLLWNGAKDSD